MTDAAPPFPLIATVTMNPSIDQHILIDRLVKDDAIRAREIRRDPGGKGLNVSRVLSELGAPTIAFGVTGGGAGYIVKRLLHEREIPFHAVEVAEETRINFIVTDRSDRTQTRISSPGPWVPLEVGDHVVDLVLGLRPAPRWWVLGGSLPPGIPADFYARLIERLQASGARCVLDADDQALRIGLEARPFAIKPNESELERLVGRSLRGESEILGAAREILRQGVELVAVSLGGEGALVVTARTAVHTDAPAVEVRSKVGAGDSFLAALVIGLARGDSLEAATCFATAAGTAAVVHEGTQLCRREDVEALLPRVSARATRLAPEPAPPPEPHLALDVVCGNSVDPELARFTASHRGREYTFCSLACRNAFTTRPDAYAGEAN